ncbi:YtxH domain-containing protein [Paenibacillus mendelii]|uniref:YtxH domain-containing protein n=1 Tax=Paenibacillus mendelii TaxID=206163 RepID=A0ABV6JMY2_9BACL|nr:YtxH domain-containing protein [Paenibacillus mendelii]MCQ6558839.1 YtxH domain-containing protein [Paenibacillus mendelii]
MGNQNNQQAGGSKMLKGLLIGSAVGATAAMLMTPKTGKDMRETIRRKSSELSTTAREKATTLAAQAKDTASSLAGHAKETASDVSDRVNELGRAAASKVATAAETTANVFQTMKREEGANPNGATNGSANRAAAGERP